MASPEELARLEEQRQAALQSQAQQEENTRKARQLLRRYPDESAHAQGRTRAMEPVVRQMSESRARLQALERERDALAQQLKQEKNPANAAGLRQRLETNGAALEAQSAVLRDREAERDRMNMQFDQELAQLKTLWVPGRRLHLERNHELFWGRWPGCLAGAGPVECRGAGRLSPLPM
ncbi:hypothetical protein [Ideonella paludis]|uniref:hypothetical protein n=1 Tax=Ideonella paludis TaxID=1233411 RepID=UPI0036455A66